MGVWAGSWRKILAVSVAVGAIALMVPAAPAGAADPLESLPATATWLETLNAWRASSLLAPVGEDLAWSAGDVAHSKYMVETAYGHGESPGAPFNTEAGAAAGLNGNVAASSSATKTDRQFVEQWITAPFHAAGMLDPKLVTSGYGAYRRAGATPWPAAATLDVLRGRTGPDATAAVTFPGQGAVLPIAQLAYRGGESPDPLSPCPGYNPGGPIETGVPVFALLPKAPTGTLTTTFTINGVPVPHCAYDETTYVNVDSNQQSTGRSVMAFRHQVIIVPRQPLTQGGNYGASISTTYAGEIAPTLTEWSFTTGALPEVSVGNASIVEGHAKTRSVRVTVSLSKPSPTPITVQYATVAGTATAPSDYSTKVGTVTIPASSTSTVIAIPVKGDRLIEPSEAFAVQLTNPQGGAVLRRSTGSVQIRTDDKAGPTSNAVRLSIGNASVVEGKTGARQVRFNISLSTTATVPVRLEYATAPGTADASDFTAKAGTITIPPGTTSVILSISVKADAVAEANEQFSVKLSSPVGASIQFGTGSGSILNDDAL